VFFPPQLVVPRHQAQIDELFVNNRVEYASPNDRNHIDDLVDKVLLPWKRRGIHLGDVDKVMEVNSVQDAACFLVQKLGENLYTIGEEDKRPEEGSWNPGQLFRTRRQNIITLLKRVWHRLPTHFEASFCLHDCVVSQSRKAETSFFGTQYTFVEDPLPAFTVVTCEDSANIPCPTWDYAAGLLKDWENRIQEMKTNRNVSWSSRAAKAAFRGGQRTCSLPLQNLTVPFYRINSGDDENAKRCGRHALIYHALAGNFENLFDVAITGGQAELKKFEGELVRPQDKPEFLSKSQQEEFKYQIVAEGECQWANRLRDALFMGPALILQKNVCVEYYGVDLQPWVHYIPVDYLFSNLTDAVVWAESHEQDVITMNRRRHAYAEDYLRSDHVEEYVWKLIRAYSSLISYNVTRRKNAVLLPL